MNRLSSIPRVRRSWVPAGVEQPRATRRALGAALLIGPVVAVTIILCVPPLFLSEPTGRLAIILGALVFGILLVRNPEVFFGLWIAGVFSVFLSFYPSLDAIHGWSLLPLAGILFYVIRRKEHFFHIGGLLLSQGVFLLILGVGVTYSGDVDYGETKVWHFLYWNLLPFAGTMFFVKDLGKVKNVLLSFALGTILLALSGLYFFLVGDSEFSYRLTAFTSCPITFGRVTGIASLILLCYLVSESHNRRWLFLPVLFPLLYVTILTGTRGVLVAFVVGAAVLTVLKLNMRPKVAIVSGVLAAVAILLAFHYAPADYTQRYNVTEESLMQEDRLVLWRSGYEMFVQSPIFGSGTGSFHSDIGGWAYYPHNIFIEIGAELGLVGLVVFIAFIYLTLKSALHVLRTPRCGQVAKEMMVVLLVCFIFSLAEAQFSADINGNWQIWFFSGFIWSVFAAARACHPISLATATSAVGGQVMAAEHG